MVSKVSLGDVCDFVRGVSFDGDAAIDVSREGYVPILRAGNIGDELYIHDDLVWVPEKRVSKEQYFQVGDIAICMASGSPAVLGKTAQLKESFIGSVGAFCGIIRPTKADPNYIAYWLKSPTFMAWRDSQANGVNIQNLRPNEVREIEIPLPPLPEQKRIASLLARADRLRQLRRTAHELGESLLQSVFLEMFGDITRNEKGWKSQRLEELCDEITVGYVGPMASEYTQSGVLFLRSQNIKPFRIDLNDVKYVSPEFHKKLKKSAIYPGNVVVVRTGLAGTATVVPDNFPETNCSDLVIIRPSSKINNQYLTMLFNSTWGKGHVEGNAVGQIQQHFNIGSANEMKVPLPPLSLQEEFAGVVARVESLRGRMSEGERQVNGLFESLLAEAFS